MHGWRSATTGAAIEQAREEERAASRATAIAHLQPILLPRLSQEEIPWEEAACTLNKMNMELLATAVRSGNVQPVVAKVKTAHARKPMLRQRRSYDEELLKQKIQLVQLQGELIPQLEQLVAPQHAQQLALQYLRQAPRTFQTRADMPSPDQGSDFESLEAAVKLSEAQDLMKMTATAAPEALRQAPPTFQTMADVPSPDQGSGFESLEATVNLSEAQDLMLHLRAASRQSPRRAADGVGEQAVPQNAGGIHIYMNI